MNRCWRRWTALPLFALAFACARGGSCAGPARPVGSDGRGATAVRTGEPATAAPAPLERPANSPRQQQELAAGGRVVRVRDGDSIVVLREGVGVDVRLDGIDCPELDQAYGRRAKGYAGELVFGKEVRLARKGIDDFGRELAEVFLPDGRSLNRELVAAGFAWRFRRHSADPELDALERAARAARRGLWADADPVPPWEFRRSRRR